MDEETLITRYNPPTRFDYAKQGTICKVLNDKVTYYIQAAKDDTIEWKPIGTIFAETFSDLFDNEEFIEELMKIYNDPEYPKNHFSDLLKSL